MTRIDEEIPRSIVSGMDWPAVPDASAAGMLALQHQLAQSQWWAPGILRAQQQAQLAQVLAQVLWMGYVVAEVSCPTKYFPEASSIGFRRSVRYGLGCVATAIAFRLARTGLLRSPLFPPATA